MRIKSKEIIFVLFGFYGKLIYATSIERYDIRALVAKYKINVLNRVCISISLI